MFATSSNAAGESRWRAPRPAGSATAPASWVPTSCGGRPAAIPARTSWARPTAWPASSVAPAPTSSTCTAPRPGSWGVWCCAVASPRSSSPTPGRSWPPRARSAGHRWPGSGTPPVGPANCSASARASALVGEEKGIVGPTSVVPNGVDLTQLHPADADDRTAARTALGLPDVPTVVCVGRLAPQKGQSDLLGGLGAGPGPGAGGPAGTGRGRPGPRGSSSDGWRPAPACGSSAPRSDVSTWFAAADVVAVPSRWEGMALVPLEAMACARSVVATDVTGMAESLPAGAGAMVPPGSPVELAGALSSRLARSSAVRGRRLDRSSPRGAPPRCGYFRTGSCPGGSASCGDEAAVRLITLWRGSARVTAAMVRNMILMSPHNDQFSM